MASYTLKQLRNGPGATRCRRIVRGRESACCWCGRTFAGQYPDPRSFTIEHLTPLHTLLHLPLADALRIAHDPARCRAACFECNSRRTHGTGKEPRPETHQRTASRSW